MALMALAAGMARDRIIPKDAGFYDTVLVFGIILEHDEVESQISYDVR